MVETYFSIVGLITILVKITYKQSALYYRLSRATLLKTLSLLFNFNIVRLSISKSSYYLPFGSIFRSRIALAVMSSNELEYKRF